MSNSQSVPDISFSDLQIAVDSGNWKTDPHLLDWIWHKYGELIYAGYRPKNFGSPEFWRALFQEEEKEEEEEEEDYVDDDDDDNFDQAWQEGGRLQTRNSSLKETYYEKLKAKYSVVCL